MSGNVTGVLVGLMVTLPGVAIGLLLLTGKWRPASLAGARDPDRARVATGGFVLVQSLLVVALLLALALLPVGHAPMIERAGIVAITVATVLGALWLLRATRS